MATAQQGRVVLIFVPVRSATVGGKRRAFRCSRSARRSRVPVATV